MFLKSSELSTIIHDIYADTVNTMLIDIVLKGSTPVYSTFKENAVIPRNVLISRSLRRFCLPKNIK